jgi:hypothetical protein
MVLLEFFSDIILPVALWSCGRLSLYRKLIPGIFPGGKGGRCVRLTTLPPSCAVVMKYGNLNLLEPSGPLQACNGTALPLMLKENCETGKQERQLLIKLTLKHMVAFCFQSDVRKPGCSSAVSSNFRQKFGWLWSTSGIGKDKGLPQQAEVTQGVPCRLMPRIFLTFGTTRVVDRQPYAPAAFTPGEIPGNHF